MRLIHWTIALLAILSMAEREAEACSTCGCGDPTLTLAGDEKPFQGRFRLFSEFRYRTEDFGVSGVNSSDLREGRWELGGLYAPVRPVLFGLTLPLVSKKFSEMGSPEQDTFGIGDIRLLTKVFLFPDRLRDGRHLVGLIGSLQMPTASEKTDSAGNSLAIEAQSGTGAWVPAGGVWYGHYRYPWSFYASGIGYFPTSGWEGFEAGRSLVNSFAGQFQITRDWATQLVFDTRWSAKNMEGGTADADSGGFLAYSTPRIMWQPVMDLLVYASIQIPTITHLNGDHREGYVFMAGVTYDL